MRTRPRARIEKLLAIKLFIVLLALISITEKVPAQGSRVTPDDLYRSATGRVRSPQEVEAMRRVFDEQMRNARFEQARSLSRRLDRPQSIESLINRERRELTRSLRRPDDNASQYGQFLKQPNTGYVTLLAGGNCVQNVSDVKLAGVVGPCADETLPGKGAYFSFRKDDYVTGGWADIGFKNDWFFSVGFVTQSILADLGETPISDVDLGSKRLKFLTEFVPATTLEDANKQRVEIESGMSTGSDVFYNAVPAIPGHTYVLRSIAYRGKLVSVFDYGQHQTKFDLLDGDSRGDAIVLVRYVGKDQLGNVRLIWRLLKSTDSPKLDLPERKVDGSQIQRRVVRVND